MSPVPHLVGVPTLTDVVGHGNTVDALAPRSLDDITAAVPPVVAPSVMAASLTDAWGDPTAEALAADALEAALHRDVSRAVLVDLQRKVDQLYEFRVREAITPLLTRVAEDLVRELRAELSGVLSDVVRRAVTQELAKRRGT